MYAQYLVSICHEGGVFKTCGGRFYHIITFEFYDSEKSLEVAITAAMNYCIDNDILSDVLEKCQSEVFNMLLTEYDAKFHEKCVRQEGHEDGIAEGIELGRADAFTTIVINALNSGMTESEISNKLLIPQETIEAAKAEMHS